MDSENRVRVAVANDYELVIAGLRAMLEPFDRVEVVDAVIVGEPLQVPTDVVLYDTFGRPDDIGGVQTLLDTEGVGRVAVYTGAPRAAQVANALEVGASAVLSKARPATSLVEAIERVHRGEKVVDGAGGHQPVPWPGSSRGLTARQSEVVALLLQGLSNQEIAESLFVDVNTVKTHLRHAYKALGVRSRAQALAMLLGEDTAFRRRSA
jgi:two-component system, NarL family, response regulator LiaR